MYKSRYKYIVEFVRSMMISPRHPMSSTYVYSYYMLRQEEKRHLLKHFYMIHPLSMFNFWWSIIVSLSLFTEYFFWPIIAPYNTPTELQILFLPHNVIYGLLMLSCFYTGIYDKENNKVTLGFRLVACKYLRTYFSFDLIAMSTVILRHVLTIKANEWDVNWRIIRILRWTLPLFKYVRYTYMLDTFQLVKMHFSINHYLYLATKLAVNFQFFLLFTNTAWFVVLREFPHFENQRPIDYAVSSAEMFMLINFGNHKTDHYIDKISPICCIIIGFVVHLILLVRGMELWQQYHSAENKETVVHSSLEAYMRSTALPHQLRERVFLYIKFKYQNHFYKDKSIIRATSLALRKEILVMMTKASTRVVYMFQRFPDDVMARLEGLLISVLYLPGDLIFKEGSYGNLMFFIISGTVKITKSDGKEVARLRDGEHFGETALVSDAARLASVYAVTPCELYALHRKHFLAVLADHPKLKAELMKMVNENICKYLSVPRHMTHDGSFMLNFSRVRKVSVEENLAKLKKYQLY